MTDQVAPQEIENVTIRAAYEGALHSRHLGRPPTLADAPAKAWRALVTAHPQWPAMMRKSGKNSGSLSKAECQALAVVFAVEDQVDAPADAEDAPAEDAPADAAPAQANTDPAGEVMREIFGALGMGDMAAARRIVAGLTEARDDAASRLAEAEARAADAMRRAATAASGNQPRAGQPIQGGTIQPTGETTLGDLMPSAGRTILTDRAAALRLTTWDGATEADPDYAPDPVALEALAACDALGKNAWLFGPAGTGKSSLPEWYAAKLGRPFVRIAFDRSTEPEDLIGGLEPDGDAFRWRDGALAQAIRTPGAVVLLDEPTLARPTALAMLQTLLDGGRHLLARATGEVIRCAPGVTFVCADNSSGNGDETGQYSGVSAMNRAFLDRMTARIEVGYMEAAKEAEVLARRSGVSKKAAQRMVAFARETRAAVDNGDMAHALGLRRLIAWASLVAVGVPSARAFPQTCVAGEAPDDAETVRQLENARLDHSQIDAEA